MTRPAPEISHASSTQTTNPVSAEKKPEKASMQKGLPWNITTVAKQKCIPSATFR